MNWIKITSETKPEFGIEVIGFSPEWINEDFNPKGTRACFLLDTGVWVSAKWYDYQDCYITDTRTKPTHYSLILKTPQETLVGKEVRIKKYEGDGPHGRIVSVSRLTNLVFLVDEYFNTGLNSDNRDPTLNDLTNYVEDDIQIL